MVITRRVHYFTNKKKKRWADECALKYYYVYIFISMIFRELECTSKTS